MQLRTGLLAVSAPLEAFSNLKGVADGAAAVASSRRPIAVFLVLVTEGSKLALLLWAIVAAFRRGTRRSASLAAPCVSVDVATGVAEEMASRNRPGRTAESGKQAAKEAEADAEHQGTEV